MLNLAQSIFPDVDPPRCVGDSYFFRFLKAVIGLLCGDIHAF